MARLYYGHVITNGVKLHYYRTGDEKPSVIFLHGISDNGLCWSRLALRLEPFYDVIMVDARGHGFSEATETGYTPEDRAADVAGLIEALHLEKPSIAGHSMGAETAVMVAAMYPKMAGCLLLEDPPFWHQAHKETPEARAQRRDHFRQQITEWRVKSLDELIQIGKQMYPNWDETDLFQWGKSKQQVNPVVFDGIESERLSWREYARQVKCPVLLITGDPLLGAIITQEVTDELKKMWKKPEIVHIEHAGHNIRRDQFELYHETVKKFLRKNTDW
ncbi:MAG: alpha/beta hydrolase [Chloroflexi bacterium]|nr:alpha/beta hydrolase [Chloroflexota bacterium]